MQKKTPLTFRISSALKNIIGSDLIPDDYIAIFELVKNSYDAHASRVEISFLDIGTKNARIVIQDNGKGMNYDDLINKWLFLAYSAKKEGTEEDNYDFRDKIKVKRAYAGAKGIGRFSCDKLGAELYLETIKDEVNAQVETLLTDWDKFESDLKDEFINISVLHETISESSFDLKHGTVLEITRLKSDWDRKKLLQLKSSLAKLINPHNTARGDEFSIKLIVPSELQQDQSKKYHERVNGEIQNLIFDTLELKTTKIVSKVSDKQQNEILTTLYEGGRFVYEIVEENSFDKLHNVSLELYFLNTSAKTTFTRRMGVRSVDYGHIFVYKNGLRIYPYGERGEDPFKMDNRKGQGYNRYIGTRESLGFISIYEPNENLRETTSRGDGLIKTQEYSELREWLLVILRRLEKFVIDIVDWGNNLSTDEFIRLDSIDKKDALRELIQNLSRTERIKDFKLSNEILGILDEKSGKSTGQRLKDIAKTIRDGDFDPVEVSEILRKEQKKLSKLQEIKTEAEDEAFQQLLENEKLVDELERELKRGAFQGALIGTDKERIISLQHQIYHSSGRIHRNIKLLLRHLGEHDIDSKTRKYISVLSLEASKIQSIAKFITKANFNLRATQIKRDIIEFISGYLSEIYIYEDAVIDINLDIELHTNGLHYERKFRPLEITTLIDVFVSNSEKANASKIIFTFVKGDSNQIELIIEDNGVGIPKERRSRVFDLGYSTTDGSGIGLYQAKQIVEKELKSKIDIFDSHSFKSGVIFKIVLP